MANVNYTITGNASDAQREVDRLRARFEKLEERLRLGAAATRRNSQQAVSGFQQQAQALARYVLQFASVGAAISGARAIFQNFIADHEKLLALRNQLSETLPEVEIRTKNQGRFNEEEFTQVKASTTKAVREIPVSNLVQGFRAQEELASQGFDRDQIISGEVVTALRNLQLSTNQFGSDAIDVKELVKSLATALRNQPGRDKDAPLTAADIREFEPKFVALFESTPAQFADLIPFARIESVLGGRGLDTPTQLAAFITALEGLGSGDVAATGLNQTTAFLQKASTSPVRKQLKKRGIELDTDQFDLIGEDFPTALENLGKQLDILVKSAEDEEEGLKLRAEAMNTLFGARNQAAVTTLIPLADRIRALRETVNQSLNDASLIPDRRENFQQSTFARQVRTEVVRDTSAREGLATQGDVSAKEIENVFATAREKLTQAGDTQATLFLATARFINSKVEALKADSGQEVLDQQLQLLRDQAYNPPAFSPTLAAFGGPATARRVYEAVQQAIDESRATPLGDNQTLQAPQGATQAQIAGVLTQLLAENPNRDQQKLIIDAEARFQQSRQQQQAVPRSVAGNPDQPNPFEDRFLEALQKLLAEAGPRPAGLTSDNQAREAAQIFETALRGLSEAQQDTANRILNRIDENSIRDDASARARTLEGINREAQLPALNDAIDKLNALDRGPTPPPVVTPEPTPAASQPTAPEPTSDLSAKVSNAEQALGEAARRLSPQPQTTPPNPPPGERPAGIRVPLPDPPQAPPPQPTTPAVDTTPAIEDQTSQLQSSLNRQIGILEQMLARLTPGSANRRDSRIDIPARNRVS